MTFYINSIAESGLILNSPDNNIVVKIAIKEKLEPSPPGERIYFSVIFNGKLIIADSPFGLEFKNMPPFAGNLDIVEYKTKSFPSPDQILLHNDHQ